MKTQKLANLELGETDKRESRSFSNFSILCVSDISSTMAGVRQPLVWCVRLGTGCVTEERRGNFSGQMFWSNKNIKHGKSMFMHAHSTTI